MATLGIHIFRRDLRVEDNTALNRALATCESVIPLFIFDPAQTNPHSYFSSPGFKFLIESLYHLDRAIQRQGGRLYTVQGSPETVLAEFLAKFPGAEIFWNRDITPFAKQRDQQLIEVCQEHGTSPHILDDAFLVSPEQSVKDDRTPYTVFTPFYKKNRQSPPDRPITTPGRFYSENVAISSLVEIQTFPITTQSLTSLGGSTEALRILSGLNDFRDYREKRDFPAIKGTTGLSPHNKFGTISPRFVYWSIADTFGDDHLLIQELYWRDFFSQIAHFFPGVFKGAFHSRYNQIAWSDDTEKFQRWCDGETGFPIVDAGMRELNATGLMHNRVRMIVASFLTKDLHLSWRWGEQYFATRLTDYDPAVNNGNWQWAASTGCDAQPYFRIFNPWLQQKRFDPEATYIKHWVPELEALSAYEIHALSEKRPVGLGYSEMIVDHRISAEQAKALFAAVR